MHTDVYTGLLQTQSYIQSSQKPLRKSIKQSHLDHLQICSSSLRGAFCYQKNQHFLEAQPHYNLVKDLRIHVSNMVVI